MIEERASWYTDHGEGGSLSGGGKGGANLSLAAIKEKSRFLCEFGLQICVGCHSLD